MHFWIDKRSQANINQCRANARLTLNRLQPLEYVRPPHQQHHHHHSSTHNNSHNNNNYNNYLNINSSSNSSTNTSNINNYLNRANCNPSSSHSATNSSSNNNSNSNMINTAATGSAHSSYRIPHHQNIDIDPTFSSNDQHQQEQAARNQPHLRWQVLVIFTFFVVTIRFYVLGNRSEVLIYCISGLILVMALLIFSALNLQKKLANSSTSPRFDGVQHTRLVNAASRSGGGGGVAASSISNQHQISTGNRCPYVQQLVLQNTGSLGRSGTNRDAQILAEAVVLLPPSPTHLLQGNLDASGRHHSESSIAPPPYDMAILLPNKNKSKKFVGIEIESSEDETPPPSYAAVTDLSN